MADVTAKSLSDTIGHIYAAAYDPLQWTGVVEAMRVHFGASKACMSRFGPGLGIDDNVSTDADMVFADMLIQEFSHGEEPLSPVVAAHPLGKVYSDHALVGRERMRASRFWNEWMAPQDMYGGLGIRLMSSDTSFWIFDMQRGRKQVAFDQAEVDLLGLLAPHLVRALTISRQLRIAEAHATSLDLVPFGMILVDASLSIVTANIAAQTLMARPGSPVRQRGDRLSLASVQAGLALRRRVQDVCGQDVTAVPAGDELVLRSGEEEGGDIALSVAAAGRRPGEPLPPEPLAMIIARERHVRSGTDIAERARRAYGLSPRESRLVLHLVRGTPLRAAADAEGIAFSTARSYLETIFSKTGTRRQTQLVALVARGD